MSNIKKFFCQYGLRATALVACLWSISFAAEATEVRFATWPEYGKNAGLVAAESSGLFANAGVPTKFIDSFQNALILLEAGEAEVAQVFCSAAVDAISRGLNAQIIAVRDQRNPVATTSKAGSGIRTPADYVGKTWGHSSGFSPERSMLGRLLELNGANLKSVDLVNLEFPARLPALLKGDVDFVSAWLGSGLPTVVHAAQDAGVKLDVIKWQDFGVDVYGECYVVKLQADGTLPAWVPSWLAVAKDGHLQAIRDPGSVGKVVLALGAKIGNASAFWIAIEQGNELLLSPGMPDTKLLSINASKLLETAKWSGLNVKDVSKMIAK